MNEKVINRLINLRACKDAVEWAEDYRTPKTAWRHCKRGDWLLWIVGKTITTEDERKTLVLAACQCARLAFPYIKKGETRPLKAIETAEAWARNENGITLADVKNAAAAAKRKETQAQCADIVRKFFPEPPSLEGI